MTKSHCLKIFKCQYLIEILRYGSDFLHVIITFIGFKITFINIRSHGAPLLISRGWRFHWSLISMLAPFILVFGCSGKAAYIPTTFNARADSISIPTSFVGTAIPTKHVKRYTLTNHAKWT